LALDLILGFSGADFNFSSPLTSEIICLATSTITSLDISTLTVSEP